MTQITTPQIEEKRFSNSLGHDYDLFNKIVPHYKSQQELVARVAVQHWPKDGVKTPILELGCGSGLTTEAIYNLAPNARVIAIDSEPNMIADLHKKESLAQYRRAGNLVVLPTDATDYLRSINMIAPESLDVVATSFMIHNFKREDRNTLHALIYKALKPGGIFVNMDKIAQDNTAEHFQAMATYMNRLVNGYRAHGLNQTADDWIAHYQVENMPDRIQIESIVKADLKATGFKHVEITDRIETDALITAIK